MRTRNFHRIKFSDFVSLRLASLEHTWVMQFTIDLAQINKKNRRSHQPRKQGWKPPDQGSVKIMLDLYGLQSK
jgi:hypothetical protein